MNGKNNTDGVTCDGIRLVCAPNPDYRTEITEALSAYPDYFPYLQLEDMGVFTTHGYDPGVPEEKLEELRRFGASLK